jgi:hypothetical protein
MTAKRSNLVVGVFDNQAQAEQAILDLYRAGFPQDNIDMATRHEGVMKASPSPELKKDAADGALTGALAGASAGAVAGALAMMLVPGLGTVIGGGLLAGVLGGAALGAAGGTFLGPFVALEMSEEEARYYSGEVEQGRTVVIVQTPDRAAEARSILQRHGGRERAAGTATQPV